MSKNICRICLRTDRKLKTINHLLSEFHDELCDYSLNPPDPQYCMECEYLLRKMYNFKQRCEMAIKIYKKWTKTKPGEKKPVNILYTLLPSSSLGVWIPDNSKIFIYQAEGVSMSNTNSQSDGPTATVKVENTNLHFDSKSKQNITRNTSEEIKLKTDSEADSPKQALQDVLTLKTEDSHNYFENVLIENDSHTGSEETGIQLQSEYFIEIQNHFDDANIKTEDEDSKTTSKNNYNPVDDDRNKTKRNNSTRKRSLSDSDTSLSSDGNDSIYRDSDSSTEMPVTKKKNINNTRKTSMKKNIDNAKSRKKSSQTKEKIGKDGSKKRLKDDEDCERIIPKKLPFSKERLKAKLAMKFASCGELKVDDGATIDKQFIINCVDDGRVTEFVMRQLWNAECGKTPFKPKSIKLLESIQNRYKGDYDSVFEIEYLNTTEKMMEEFEKRKTYECYVNTEYKCDVCYQGFKHGKQLDTHQKCHDPSAGEFMCPICSVRHIHRKSFIRHMSNSHEAVYKCKMCPLVTYYRSSMVKHYHQHKGMKFRCEPCNVSYRSKSSYKSHMGLRHRRGRHVCTWCGREFVSEKGLSWHKTRQHQNEPPSTEGASSARCDQCELTFPSTEVFLTHVRITHEVATRGRPAGMSSTYNSQKPRRPCLKPKKKPVHTCRVCNAVGHSIGWLTLHFSMEHPTVDMDLVYADKKTHLCEVCGKGFSTVYNLRVHLNLHTGARPFACAACPKRFHRAVSLREHRHQHAPPSKPCAVCGKKFRTTSNLDNHMRVHIGDRRYKCSTCGKGFLHRGSLNEHVRGVHYNMRRVRKRGLAEAGAGLLLSAEEGD